MAAPRRLLIPSVALFLAISGAAGLVYQIVWMRYLALFLGHTSYAVVAVLMAFMGGMALGNAWLGIWADRAPRPLLLYAVLEIGIGLYAMAFPFLYDHIQQAYIALAQDIPPGIVAFSCRFAFGLLTLLIPSVLMGGTLPVLVRLITRSLGELRSQVAMLYATNSLGAVVGCFLADFWWIPALGLEATVLAGAAMNLLVGAAALVLERQLTPARRKTAHPDPAEPDPETYSRGEWRLAIAAAGISGFTAMLYEVVWTRMLGLAIGSSTHAFSIMLITFITGISAGAWLVTRYRGSLRSLDAFGRVELALAAALMVSMWTYELVPYAFARLAALLSRQPNTYPYYELAQGIICFSVMFIPTLLLGISLPLLTRVATKEFSHTGRSVGAVFATNTLGTVLGAAIAGLALIPWLGLAKTFALGIAINAWLGLLTVKRNRWLPHPGTAIGTAFAALLFAMILGGLLNPTWQRVFSFGLWRLDAPPSLSQFRQATASVNLEYYRDGAGASVSVESRPSGNQTNLTLRVNGKEDAGTAFDMPTQILLAHIPILLQPNPKDVLIVGLGSGITAGSALQHEEIQDVEVVEISPEVLEAAKLFSPFNHNALDHPKCRVILDDAKSYLQLANHPYDVIISEPSNPWMAGVATVFSREFYEQCRQSLRPTGVMAQWVQVYETNDDVLRLILNTFASVFPEAAIWQPTATDLILVSRMDPQPIDLQQLRQRLAAKTVQQDLERIDLYGPAAFLAREIIPGGDVQHLIEPGGRVQSDFYPLLEYAAQRAFFVRGQASLHQRYNESISPRPGTLLGQHLLEHPLTPRDLQALTLFHLTHNLPNPRIFNSILQRWKIEDPTSPEPWLQTLNNLNGTSTSASYLNATTSEHEQILNQQNAPAELLQRYADALYQAYREERSAFYLPPSSQLTEALKKLETLDPTRKTTCQLILAELAWDRGDDETCLKLAQAALMLSPETAQPTPPDPLMAQVVMAKVIESFLRDNRYTDALLWANAANQAGLLPPANLSPHPPLLLACRRAAAQGSERAVMLSP